MTEEVIYSSEKTNLEPQLEGLCKQADEAKNWTHRMVKDIESVLTPNPGKLTIYSLSCLNKCIVSFWHFPFLEKNF